MASVMALKFQEPVPVCVASSFKARGISRYLLKGVRSKIFLLKTKVHFERPMSVEPVEEMSWYLAKRS